MTSCSKGQRKSFRNKYLALAISMLLFFGANAQTITYTPMTAAGYQMKYLKTDSGFALPVRDTAIGRGVDRPGLMVINPVDSLPYYYNGSYWKPVYVDSSGVIELINGKVDSVTVNGNNIFYWVAGLGYGQQLNKLDSIHVSADSVFTCIAGTCTFAYKTTAGTGTVTQIIAGFGLTGDTITASGTIAVDTSVFHTSNYNDARYAPISHTHAASDIISGVFPIVRGGTGLSGIGAPHQFLRVNTAGTGLEYYTSSVGNADSLGGHPASYWQPLISNLSDTSKYLKKIDSTGNTGYATNYQLGLKVDQVGTNSDSTELWYRIGTDTTVFYNITTGLTGGDTTVFQTVIDSTGQPGQRVLWSANSKIHSDQYFLYDSARHKLVIGNKNISIGGTSTKFYLVGNAIINGSLTAASLIKQGGTSSQFLKADGSVDTNTYQKTTDSVNVALLNGGKIDTSHLPKQNFLFQYPLYAVNDSTAGLRNDSLPLMTLGTGADTSLISGRKLTTADWVLARVGSGGGGSTVIDSTAQTGILKGDGSHITAVSGTGYIKMAGTTPSYVTSPNDSSAYHTAQIVQDSLLVLCDLRGRCDTVGISVAQSVALTTLTDSATIIWNYTTQTREAKVTLAGNRTLSITNLPAGKVVYLTLGVIQDATGSRTLTLPAGTKVINGGAGAVTLSTAANAVDILSFRWNGTTLYCTYGKNYN